MGLEAIYNMVVRSVNLLAKPYDELVKEYPVFVYIPEDVISDFEESFLRLPQLIEANYFTIDVIASIIRLYNEMQWCAANIGIEDIEVFKSHDRWNKLREHANDLLNNIHKSKRA